MRILLIGGAGYVGSYLNWELREAGYDVDVCDHLARGWPDKTHSVLFPHSHTNLSNEVVRSYDTVLWFAGKSSVKAAADDPDGAMVENCLSLAALRRRMRPESRLIYASSASLYSLPLDSTEQPMWSMEEDTIGHGITAYDRSKACMDGLTQGFFANTVALRMGTVCGFSPNLRPELLFNAMVLSALRDSVVKVSNPMTWRSILFLQDLSETVKACIRAEDPPRILNVCSLSTTMENLAYHIARFFRVETETLPPSPTYNFRMSTNRMLSLISYNPSATRLGSHIKMFADSVRQVGVVA
jgi:UDP-glucose 4-epimerase